MRVAGRTSAALISLAFFISAPLLASTPKSPSTSPQVLTSERANLFLESAKKPLAQLAPELYRVATDSERCRLANGAKACGLPSQPLKSGSLEDVFKYYVGQPVETALGRQKIGASASDWTWKSPAPSSAHSEAKK
ncbi:MAG: hypothetical protein ACRD3D_10635 [Terriglobia bacterium]